MAQQPAFMFYSNDYYEGTRMMLPEERACYLDLLVYQHQHDFIPLDLKRVLLYCTGVSLESLKTVINEKFIMSENGYYNEKLKQVMNDREAFSKKQSINGTVGQFWKKAKSILDRKKYGQLHLKYSQLTNNELFNEIKDINIDKAMLEAMLIAKLKHLEDEDIYINTNNNLTNNKSENLVKIETWMKDNAPRVLKLEQQMTDANLETLYSKYDKSLIAKKLIDMNNKKDLLKKYVSVYDTLTNWIERENGNT